MKTYTFAGGSLTSGIKLTPDEKLGHVVFLGETGRGRRFEKIGLNRNNPAVVVEPTEQTRFGENYSMVLEAHPLPITLNKGLDTERVFYTLAKPNNPSTKVLVRINTQCVYTRDSRGYWETIKGNPETLVQAYGARGDAGNVGKWNDGLVVMSPGDVLKVKMEGGHKNKPYALVYDQKKGLIIMSLADYESLVALEASEETVETPNNLETTGDEIVVAETQGKQPELTLTIPIDVLEKALDGDSNAIAQAKALLEKAKTQ